jgi:hypothetical protein
MFIEPASKVSVPFTVVNRMRSNVPPKFGEYPEVAQETVLDEATTPETTQTLFEPKLEIITEPPCVSIAAGAIT